MGLSLAWCYFEGGSEPEILDIYGLRHTGDCDVSFESRFCLGRTKGGALLIIGQGCDNLLMEKVILAKLSSRTTIYTCSMEEHVMFSEATCWNSGRRLWRVSHDGSRDVRDIETEGALPEFFSEMCVDLEKKQMEENGSNCDNSVDYIFEIPLVLSMKFTQFRPDAECTAFPEGSFCVLEPKRRSLLDRILRR